MCRGKSSVLWVKKYCKCVHGNLVMGNLSARLFCDLRLKCMNHPRMKMEVNFPKWCPSLAFMPVGLFTVVVAFSVFIQSLMVRVGDCFVSRYFWCFSFLMCGKQMWIYAKGKESWILILNHLWKCWIYQEQWINVVLTGECWGLSFLWAFQDSNAHLQ